jgi:hypothetical protein
MHCARLGCQRRELLTTGRLRRPLEGEPADWLRGVRRGDVPFEEWWRRTLQPDAELEDLRDTAEVPEGPDRAAIEAWSVRTHLAWWQTAPSRP